jgi:hypothetical protein
VLEASHPPHSGRFLVLISVRCRVNSKVKEWLEGLGQLKNPLTSLGTETTTFKPATQLLTQLCYHINICVKCGIFSLPYLFIPGLFNSYQWLYLCIIERYENGINWNGYEKNGSRLI